MNPPRFRRQKKAFVAQANPAPSSAGIFGNQVNNPANWFGILILVLPLAYFKPALDLFGPLRIGILSVSLLGFIGYFILYRLKEIEFPLCRKVPMITAAAGLMFFLQLLLSTAFAINKEEALYSSLQFGLFLVTAFLVAHSLRSQQFNLTTLFKAAAIALIVQSLVGISQFYGCMGYLGKILGMSFEPLNVNAVKPYGLMHNRNLYSSYCALLIPFCIYLLYAGSLRWKVTSGIAVWLGLYSLIIGQTRSAWLAVAAAFLVINIAALLLRKRLTLPVLRNWAIGMVLFILGGLLALILAAIIPNRENLNQSLQQRFSTLTGLLDKVMDSDEADEATPTSKSGNGTAGTGDAAIQPGNLSSNRATLPAPTPTPTPAPTPIQNSVLATKKSQDDGHPAIAQENKEASTEAASGTQESVNVRFFFWQKCIEMMLDKPVLGAGPGNWRIAVQKYHFYGTHEWFVKKGGVFLPDWAHNLYLQTGAEIGLLGLLLFLALWIAFFVMAIRILCCSNRVDHLVLVLALLAVISIYAVDSAFSFPNKSPAHSFILTLAFALLAVIYEQTEWPVKKEAASLRFPKAICLLPVALLLTTSYLSYARQHFETHMRKAIRNCASGQYPQAIENLNKARIPLVSMAQRPFPLDYYRTLAHIELGQFDLALEAVQNALKYNPWNVVLLNTKGYIFSRMKKTDEAIAAYKDTLAIAPKFEQALKNIGAAYYSKSMFKESSDALLQTPYTSSKGFVIMLGSALMSLKNYPKAAEVFRAGQKSLPPAQEIIENLVWLESVKLKDPTNALIHLQQLKELNPRHPKLAEYERLIQTLPPK